MNKKRKNRICSFILLLFFIGSQIGLSYHNHNEDDSQTTCEHSGSESHIHNKHTDKCEICQHNLHSKTFFFRPKKIRFFRNNNFEITKDNGSLESIKVVSIHLRGPPIFKS
jgi:hypothetical protein